MKRILSISCYFLCIFVLIGCPSPYSEEMYYSMQNSKKSSSDILLPPPVVEEDPGDSGDPEEELPEDSTLLTMFEVLQPNGAIDGDLLIKFPQDVQDKVRAALGKDITPFTTDSFKSKLIIGEFDANNVPKMHYTEGGWSPGSDVKYLTDTTKGKYWYKGDDLWAQKITAKNIKYYKYDGKNIFYGASGNFNTATYGDGTDTIMNRFVFYRFTGTGFGMVLDNPLVAVDTYTGLFFVFAKPTSFSSLGIPQVWEAVDVATTAPDGKKYKFYEYDPAGYIKDNKFVLKQWYIDGQTTSNYDPPKTDLSPYLHRVIIGGLSNPAEKFDPVITATTLEEDGVLQEREGENKGKYYTAITFPEKKFDVNYELYIREGELGEWSIEPVAIVKIPAKTTEASARTYRHYDALILTDLPQYKVIAKDAFDDKVELGTSAAVIGSRMLTEREILLATIETIRRTINWEDRDDRYYFVQSSGGAKRMPTTERKGFTGTYYHGIERHCFNSTLYRRYQRFADYKNSFITLNGTFMKDNGWGSIGKLSGTWTHIGKHPCVLWLGKCGVENDWTMGKVDVNDKPDADVNLKPRTDELTVSYFGVDTQIVLDTIIISPNGGKLDADDENDPQWTSGSFKIGKTEYDNTSGVPFGFFMDAATFRSKIGVAGYTQK